MPAPAGLISGGAPQPDGTMWVLAGSPASRTIQEIDVATSKTLGVVPVSASASALTELSTGVIAVGTATSTAGSVELRDGSTGALTKSIALSAPVRSLAAGANGTDVYALVSSSKAAAVDVVDTSTGSVVGKVPVSLGAVSVVGSPGGSSVYVLSNNGAVEQLAVTGGAPAARFSVGHSGIALAISPSGSALYALKGGGSVRNVAVVSTATESVQRVLPAPAGAVGVQVSADGTDLYDLVGTSGVGNVQVFPVGG